MSSNKAKSSTRKQARGRVKPEIASNSEEQAPKNESEPKVLKPASNIDDLWEVANSKESENDWVLRGLVMPGDQIIVSGAPKTCKSFFATHLGLALANEEDEFLGWKVAKRQKVLFLSMEMGERLVAQRTITQLGGKNSNLLKSKSDREKIPFCAVFQIDNLTAVDVTKPEVCRRIKASIDRIDPDLVIFDSLVRFHQADENNNREMSTVLQNLRDLCRIKGAPGESIRYRTSIIIHHNRKVSNNARGKAAYGAETMRGASSIHSEADLVLSLANNWGNVISLNISSRKIPQPKYRKIELHEKSLRMVYTTEDSEDSKESKKERAKEEADKYRVRQIVKTLANLAKPMQLTDVERELAKDSSYKDPEGKKLSEKKPILLRQYKGILEEMASGVVVGTPKGAKKVEYSIKPGADWKAFVTQR